MNDLISVIVPAYNAEARIRFMLESVISQDYDDLEIILVNDDSHDSTEDIAHEILGASGRAYKIITHEHNKGVSASRNTGLKHSQGRYICFVDSDDLLRVNFVSCLYGAASSGNYQIVFCGLTDRFTDGKPDKNFHSANGKPYSGSGEEFILTKSIPSFYCCIYDAEFLKQYRIMFYEGCTAGEDMEFITKALCRAERVTSINEYLYIYIHHSEMGSIRDSNTMTKKILRYEHNTNAQMRTAEYLVKYAGTQRLRDMAIKIMMPYCIIRMFNTYAMKNDRKSYDLLLRDSKSMNILRRALSFYVLKNKPDVFFKAFMISFMPSLYYRMRESK